MNFGLSDKNVELITGVLTDCGATKAAVFGSRAKGNFRYNSDIDIAVWGNVRIGHILTELDELPMPYKFDVVSYETIKNDKLREHIDRVGKPLID
ncbi:MAG: nucleotidyltransferase domain-containing protein [Ruminococcus sp.]|jgi:predicted nucleotidyltransferase|nr:nucleotidyltransferase domain-containing protein [Ruminococcus sp.]